MEIVSLLQTLWRRRYVAALGIVPAVAVAMLLAGRPGLSSGAATTRVAFDTPKSQLVADAPKGADSLPWRATLFATLLAADPSRQQIARELGIRPAQLEVIDLELTNPSIPASLPRAATKAASVTTEPYVLTVHTDGVLPLVAIAARAPGRAAAARLAEAAVHALKTGISTVDTKDLQGLSVERVSPIEAKTIPGGPGRGKALGMAMAVLILWCAALTLIPAVRSAWRNAIEAQAIAD
jgi:hypothetical protein